MKTSALLLLLFASAVSVRANVKLPALFSDHMVVQANAPAPVWGWAEPGEEITVSLAGQTKTTKADAEGRWKVQLDPLKTNDQPLELTVAGKNTVTVKDVLVGEVWLGSGQSNMALNVGAVKNADEEIAAATLPALRMFKVSSDAAETAQEDCKGSWVVTSPATVRLYSATAYFFGRELHQKLGVPVGLINSSVGGTRIESWISLDAQQRLPDLKAAVDSDLKIAQAFNFEAAKAKYEQDLAKWKVAAAQAKAEGKTQPLAPRDLGAIRRKIGVGGELFNGKIAPLIPYAIRGVVWYQGEANSAPAKAVLYAQQLPALIADWRTRWGSEFPFAWVQLPNFDGGEIRDWPAIRESMLKTLQVKDTGMAIAIDVGEAKNIHPKNKQEVGHRLALWALGTVYGKEVPSTSGPLPAGHEIRGHEVVLSFEHADGGLVAKDGELKGFVIAGEDKKWVPATAKIEGGKVIVSSPEVPKPAAVRYAWENNPVCNLYNGAGLPASPFRTDDWK
ncbi:MAG TPA: sialate O-acetylesterase [Chthoniobacteraceae bacterium]|jgi:sialate O-acetylesterase|nr:sialate O-acetylesterase [Chthoniobacteraceae bacterium]